MKWFANLKIGAKLALGFGICLFLAGGVGFTALRGFSSVMVRVESLAEDSMMGLVGVGEIQAHTRQFRTLQYRLAGNTDPQQVTKVFAQLDEEKGLAEKGLSDYEKTITDPVDRANFDDLKKSWGEYMSIHDRIKDTVAKADPKTGFLIVEKETTACFLNKIAPSLKKISEWNEKAGKKSAAGAESTVASSRNLVIAFLSIALLSGALMGWFITKGIKTPIAALSSRMQSLEGRCVTGLMGGIQAMEQGDLTVRVTPVTTLVENPSKDELGLMCSTFNSMLAKTQAMIGAYEATRQSLTEIVEGVQGSAVSVAEASGELTQAAEQTGQAANEIAATIQEVAQAAGQSATTSQEMASGSEQQARTATEAAGAMERLQSAIEVVEANGARSKEATAQADLGMKQASKAVEEVAESARQMAVTAKQASSVAKTGGHAVEQTISSMTEIKEQMQASAEKVKELDKKGQEIGAIVETIDQIAEQTNLLALNAAIEAARAGEHGKGFAVVADEVRKLAERATSATKEIGTLIGGVRKDVDEVVKAIEASNKQVADGAARSKEAGEALGQILAAANEVAEQVEGVSAITGKMSASVDGVLAKVETVRQVAEEQERAVSEMAAGSVQVNGSITTVASISQETAAGAEQMSASAEEVSASAQNVSAAVEEQTASIEQVSAAATSLNGMAVHLKELVSRFKLETDGTSVESGKTQLKVVGGTRKAA